VLPVVAGEKATLELAGTTGTVFIFATYMGS